MEECVIEACDGEKPVWDGMVRYGETILVDMEAANAAAALDTAFIRPEFLKAGQPLCRRDGSPVSRGACQFFGHGWREYGYRFVVPRGADGSRLLLSVDGQGALQTRNMHVQVCRQLPAPCSPGKGTKFIAHLGMIGYAPKNTMAAFYLARRAGFSECVLNTNFTKDGQLVTLHNDTIDATSNGTGDVSSFTLSELRQFDFGSAFSEAYTGEPIPLVRDVLVFMAHSGMRPVIRLSSRFIGGHVHYLQALVDLVRDCGLNGQCTVKAFSKNVLDAIAALAGDRLRYGFCCSTFGVEEVSWIKSLGRDVFIDQFYEKITPAHAELALNNDVALETWIINDFAGIVRLAGMGVTGFTTDYYNLDGCLY